MIAGIILTGAFIAAMIFLIASGNALIVCEVIKWIFEKYKIHKYIRYICQVVTYVAVTYWLYMLMVESMIETL